MGTDLYLDDFKVLDGLRKFFQKLENSIIESIEDEEGQMAEGTNIPLAFSFHRVICVKTFISYKFISDQHHQFRIIQEQF